MYSAERRRLRTLSSCDPHALVRQEGKDPQYDGNDHETDPKVFLCETDLTLERSWRICWQSRDIRKYQRYWKEKEV